MIASDVRLPLFAAVVLTVATVSGVVQAQEIPLMARGSKLVALGNGRGAYACASCHGFEGAADPSGQFPRLAGLSADYIQRELDAYADGRRRNTIMSHIAQSMTEAERANAAAYYENAHAAVPPAPSASASLLTTGDVIANIGLNDSQVPACSACHGPYGRSYSPQTPSLAGQYSHYIETQLMSFRNGHRKVGAEAMVSIAHSLTNAQVQAVAAYFQHASSDTPALTGSER